MDEGAVERMEAAVGELAVLDVDSLGDAALDALVRDLARVARRFDAVRARVVGAWETRGGWAADGSKSAAAALARVTGDAPREARRACRRARRLRTMPATAAAFAAGRIGVDHVDALIRANQPELNAPFTRDEALLVDHAQTLSYADFQRVLRYWEHCADDTRAESRADADYAARHLHVSTTFAGTLDVRGTLDPINGEIFSDELERLEHHLFETDWAHAHTHHGDHTTIDHLPRSPTQRRADALVEMARRSAAAPPDAKPARPLITVHVDHHTLAGRICETARGTILTPGHITRLLLDAEIERVVFHTPSRVIDVSHRTRFFRGALRRAIEVRDRHCTHPGCNVPAHHCDIDHIVPYDQGGTTTQDNGRLLCPHHNHWTYNHHQTKAARAGPGPP